MTQADRRRGRGSALQPTPVKALAIAAGIPVTHQVRDAPGFGAELGVVVAFGRIIPGAVLDELQMVNLHLSLLPRWRGAAPVERAILAGDEETGVCLMALDEGLDTGAIYWRAAVRIGPNEHADELTRRLADLGTAELIARLAKGVSGLGAPLPQIGEATYAHKLDAQDRHLDFSLPAAQVDRVVRIGRAFTSFRGRRLIVHRAQVVADLDVGGEVAPGDLVDGVVATSAGGLRLEVVQLEGRAPQEFSQFAAGQRLGTREHLGGDSR